MSFKSLKVVSFSDGAFQVIEAKTPQAVVGVEGEDARVDARYAQVIPIILTYVLKLCL